MRMLIWIKILQTFPKEEDINEQVSLTGVGIRVVVESENINFYSTLTCKYL